MRDSHAHYVLKRCMRPEPEISTIARLLLNEADGYARRAHQMQTQLIGQDAGEARQPMTLIMVHAQDEFDEFAAGPRVLRRINPSVPALINME